MKRKAVVIMNPVSGMKLGKRYLADILYLFAQDGYETLCLMTQKRGDGEALAREHAPGADVVVCIGGDGTYTEVAAGVIASGAGTPIGYIPAGSTNDFANSLKLSRDLYRHGASAGRYIVFACIKLLLKRRHILLHLLCLLQHPLHIAGTAAHALRQSCFHMLFLL